MITIMKWMLVVLILFIVCVQPLTPVEIEWALKGGPVSSQARISLDLPGITYGPLHEISLGSHVTIYFLGGQFGIQPEIHFSVKGFNVLEPAGTEDVSSRYKISYIEIPLLCVYRLPLRGKLQPGLAIGPYIAIGQKASEVQSGAGLNQERDLGDNLTRSDLGLLLETNVRYRMGKAFILLAARYAWGLVSVSRNIRDVAYDFDEQDSIKNRSFSVLFAVGYRIL